MAATFDAAWRRARRARWRAVLRRRCRDELTILPYADAIATLGRQGEPVVVRHDVPIDAIVGTVSRVCDFDRQLRPRNRCLRDRWDSVARACRALPPVALIRLGDLYFIEDGHHRVSVARARGVPTVRAFVRHICTVGCAHRCLTAADLASVSAKKKNRGPRSRRREEGV